MPSSLAATLKPLAATIAKYRAKKLTDDDIKANLVGKAHVGGGQALGTGILLSDPPYDETTTSSSSISRHNQAQKQLFALRQQEGEPLFYLCLCASAITPLSRSNSNSLARLWREWKDKPTIPEALAQKIRAVVHDYKVESKITEYQPLSSMPSQKRRHSSSDVEELSAKSDAENTPKRSRVETLSLDRIIDHNSNSERQQEATPACAETADGEVQTRSHHMLASLQPSSVPLQHSTSTYMFGNAANFPLLFPTVMSGTTSGVSNHQFFDLPQGNGDPPISKNAGTGYVEVDNDASDGEGHVEPTSFHHRKPSTLHDDPATGKVYELSMIDTIRVVANSEFTSRIQLTVPLQPGTSPFISFSLSGKTVMRLTKNREQIM